MVDKFRVFMIVILIVGNFQVAIRPCKKKTDLASPHQVLFEAHFLANSRLIKKLQNNWASNVG
jgi:hypothetical protein